MGTWTDAALDRTLRRTRKRREKAGAARAQRLDARIAQLEGWRALPEAERPARRLLPVRLESVQGVLRTVANVLAGTPAGPILSALALGVGAIDRVSEALRAGDREALVAAVGEAVAARVGADADDVAGRVVDELEDALG